ncbi:uncharacterized protein [Nicotiana tomentosiformis]|uniref:uncharacterized protein n=1 Tax=Nicotiana tomentosiformis TaxID=4098 RepID=UPI00388C5D09
MAPVRRQSKISVQNQPYELKGVEPEKFRITHEIHQLASLGVRLLDSDTGVTIQDTTTSPLATEVKECQYEDHVLAHYRDTSPQKENTPFEITGDGILKYLGVTNMYRDIKGIYWWDGMKKDIAEFVAQCPNCQQLVGPELVQEAVEKIKLIRERLLAAQSSQKSYADNRRRDLEFQVDDWVFLKVSPMKDIMRFDKKGKLSPRYIGPYKIIRIVVQVAYELDLPSKLESVHPVFHVSMLRRCIGDPSKVIPVDDAQVTEQLPYEEAPIAILDRQVQRLRTKDVASVKVLWINNNVKEMTQAA